MKKNSLETNNYRLVSILRTALKVFERLMQNQSIALTEKVFYTTIEKEIELNTS